MDNKYTNKLKDSLYWWLSYTRPFIINNEYQIELLHIDKVHQSVKIRITNLKTQEVTEQETSGDSNDYSI
jgi:hypothetical protein